eukprot:TRINITY_DN55560_c0_g1_i1.p1 TRINITY_DN55560_c0_g1~~TRINITY_DN55560_c0_g1_i1.p1  ORF type:complete len:329 (+),score=83.17 TRINITY_DN55560_c0_g1_i1:73-1059(+)
MPVQDHALGCVPRISPIKTHALRVWTMNFAAACGEARPEYWEAAADAEGRVDGQVAVHPLFLSSTAEILGFWGGVYGAGFTKSEVTRFPLVHAAIDTTFAAPLTSGAEVESRVDVVGLGRRRSGTHIVVRVRSAAAGRPVATSHWDGVLVGHRDSGAAGGYPRELQAPAVPQQPPAGAVVEVERSFSLPATCAHVWDACVRDPRVPKSAAADINVHTHVGYARAGRLKHRTANGLTTLAFALRPLLALMRPGARLARVACAFGAPVFLQYDSVPLRLLAACHTDGLRVWFEVRCADGSRAVRGGFVELESAGSPAPRAPPPAASPSRL